MMDDNSSGTSAGQKRQREPLSDAEDNVVPSSELNDCQKRRRLDLIGQENRSPKPSSRRLAELEVKGDTPAILSVRSRVQQLTQHREGGPVLAQRCLSDPGSDNPSFIIQDKIFKEQLLGEAEFSQRAERFREADLQPSPSRGPTPGHPGSLTLSSAVTSIQQRLQGSTTPSSKQASRLRQERKEELRLLCSHPISDNAWLKRSMSDSSLNEADCDAGDGALSGGFSAAKDDSFTQAPGPSPGPSSAADDTLGRHPDASATSASVSDPIPPEDGVRGAMTTEPGEGEEGDAILGKEVEGAMETEPDQRVGPVVGEPEEDRQGSSGNNQGDGEIRQGQSEADKEHHVNMECPERAFEDGPRSVTKRSSQDKLPSKLTSSPISREPRCPSVLGHGGKEFSTKEDMVEVSAQSLVDVGEEMESDQELRALDSDEELRASPSASQRWVVSPLYEVLGDPSAKAQDSLSTRQGKAHGPDEHAVRDLDSSDEEGTLVSVCLGQLVSEFHYHTTDSDLTDIEEVATDHTVQIQPSRAQKQRSKEFPSQDLVQVATDRHADTGQTQNPDAVQLETYHETHSDLTEQPVTTNEEVDREVVGDEEKRLRVEHIDPEHKAMETVERQMAEEHRREGRHQTIIQQSNVVETATRVGEKLAMEADRGGVCTEEKQPETSERPGSRGGSSKKVTFVLKPELIDGSDMDTSTESREEASLSEADASCHDETNTAEMIDQMFEEVLEAAGQTQGESQEADDHDSGIAPGSGEKKEEEEEEEAAAKDTSEDEMLTFPPCGILSPLSKSVETVVTPMRLAVGQRSNPPSLLLSPEEEMTPPPLDSAPLYSIDAYRTQRQKKLPAIQSVTPGVQRRAQEKSRPQRSVNTKDRIVGLNEEVGKLQTVISQTLQALSCCTDEGHGRGSLEEAEAEKLLLVSSEKRSALLSEVARLKDTGPAEPEEKERDKDYVTQQPCRGTVSISQVQLPLKVEFVCSSRSRTGRPSHYFFVLIRYGPCHIVATPLATAVDALNGDTVSFSTSVTLQDIRPNFEIDVEVYSLSHASTNTGSVERSSAKSRVTPRKILKTMKLAAVALPVLNPRRSSNFSLVGSHKITLASLGQSKFPLDKMKFEGKIRRLLGDEFQEKVPFLSPLEGNIYLHLDSQSHSNVQHQGFLTMFEVLNGFGAWHRRFFVLEGEQMSHWNHPNDRGTKPAEGSILLSSTSSQGVKPVKRDSCARPFTFELVSSLQGQEQDNLNTKAKCWFSADTKEECAAWMEKLNQVLLDLHTWTRRAHCDSEVSQTTSTSSFSSTISTIRESTL
ncbi:anillin, actin binding protein 2 [Aplochiton taeniatus]